VVLVDCCARSCSLSYTRQLRNSSNSEKDGYADLVGPFSVVSFCLHWWSAMGSKPFHQLISWDGGRSNRPVTIVEGDGEHNRLRCSGNGSRNLFLSMSSSFSSRFHRR
jgi:hypothetical protein